MINKPYCHNNSREFFLGGRMYNLCTDVAMTTRHILRYTNL
jgi:hypothetical protein